MRARFVPHGLEITCDTTKERETMKAWLAAPDFELKLVYCGFSRRRSRGISRRGPWLETPETNALPHQIVIGRLSRIEEDEILPPIMPRPRPRRRPK